MKKTRAQKSWSMRNVPQELWQDILLRVPVKSLLRFRCVSRSWNSSIADSDFVRSHLSRFNNNLSESHLFVVQSSSYPGFECFVKCSQSLRTTTKLGFLQSNKDSIDTLRTTFSRSRVRIWVVVCSIDGLFMLRASMHHTNPNLMLWNPSIRKTRMLPPSPEISLGMICADFGLGFDLSSKDYKFVRLVSSWTTGVEFVAIYTLGTNSWKTIKFREQGCLNWKMYCTIHNDKHKVLCFNGVLYALAKDSITVPSPLKLVSFDFSSELFASTGLPVVDCPQSLTIVDDGCSLALVNMSKPEGSMWVLERLGDDIESWTWTQRFTFHLMIPVFDQLRSSVKFLFFKKNGEMVLYWHERVIFYNLETHKYKTVLKNNLRVEPYTESLLLQ